MNEAVMKLQKTQLGFWLYLMSDIMLFATLFAVFQIQRNATAGNVSGHDIFDLPYIFGETILLLASSVSAGIAWMAAEAKKVRVFRWLLILTVLLGLGFLIMELSEFARLAADGHSWQASGFLSAYFTLVGTHGLHISVGIIWAVTLLVMVWLRGLDHNFVRKIGLFTLFWHFLDLVWIFIFTVVYLMGAS